MGSFQGIVLPSHMESSEPDDRKSAGTQYVFAREVTGLPDGPQWPPSWCSQPRAVLPVVSQTQPLCLTDSGISEGLSLVTSGYKTRLSSWSLSVTPSGGGLVVSSLWRGPCGEELTPPSVSHVRERLGLRGTLAPAEPSDEAAPANSLTMTLRELQAPRAT